MRLDDLKPSPSLVALTDRLPCGLLLFRDDGEILDANSTLLQWLRLNREELAGRHIDAILPPGGKIFYQTHLFPLLRASRSVSEVYFALRGGDGREIPVLIAAVRDDSEGVAVNLATFVVINNRQQFEGALLRAWKSEQAAREESERKSRKLDELVSELRLRNEALDAVQAELRRSNASKDDFIGLVSHELKNPLIVLSGTASILSRNFEEISREESRQMLDELHGGFARLLGVVDNLLTIARSEMVTVDLEPILLQRYLPGLIAREQARIPGTAIMVRLPDDLPLALGAPGAVEQIVLNLLSNARKYGTPGCPIVISAEASGDRVRVTVANDGEMLSQADVERFFQAFYRDKRQRDTAQGIGLGLTVCQRLAQAQDATIEAKPRAAGGLEITLGLQLFED